MKATLATITLAATIAIASAASSDEAMKNDFIAFDLNSDGNVDASEVRKEFKGLSQKDISGFFIAADTNEDGLIDFEEYRNASLAHESGDLSIEDYTYQ